MTGPCHLEGAWFSNTGSTAVWHSSASRSAVTINSAITDNRNRGFSCLICGKNYVWRANMQRHMRHECGKQPTLSCPMCPYQSKYKYHLLRHINLRHKDTNVFPYNLFDSSLMNGLKRE